MRKPQYVLVIAVALLLVACDPQTEQPPTSNPLQEELDQALADLQACQAELQACNERPEEQPDRMSLDALADAATERGVSIVEDTYASASLGGLEIALVSLIGVETIPATEYPGGVDSAFMYYDNPADDIPSGYYTIRITSEEVTDVGDVPARIEWLGEEGRAVAEQDATMTVESLEVPTDVNENIPGNVGIPSVEYGGDMIVSMPPVVRDIIFWCRNGVHVHGEAARALF